MHRFRTALWPISLLAGLGAFALIATSDHETSPVVTAALTLVVGLSFAASGLVAWSRRPENIFGALMVAAGLAWFARAAASADESFAFTLGLLVQNLVFALLAHLLLAFPRGRLESTLSRVLVAAVYVDVIAVQLVYVLFTHPESFGCEDCPANELLVSRNDELASGIRNGSQLLGVLIALTIAWIFVRRWQVATPAARRMLGPLLAAGGLSSALTAAWFVADFADEDAGRVGFWLSMIALATVPLAFLAGILRGRLARANLGQFVVELGRALPPGELRDAIARALGDPSVSIAYWLPASESWVRTDGRRLPSLPENDPARFATVVEVKGSLVAAIVHDAMLLDDPELIDAVVAAARLALETERRVAELSQSEERNRALLNAIPDLMFRIGRDGTYRAFKADRSRDLAVPPEQLIGSTVYEILPPETAERLMRCAHAALDRGSVETVEYELELSGERRSFEARVVVSAEDEVLMIVRDFTERKRAEAELDALQGELRQRLAELQASRARIVEATDNARRRLERNLHDGAQQRLVSVSLSLRLAHSKLGNDLDGAAQLLEGASEELSLALAELRELARGIHPAILTDRGLGPALEALVGRTQLDIDVATALDERLPEQVEATAYYVVSEALANVSKYAEATSAQVRVARSNGRATVEVRDNGIGGADASRGSGLRGLADRVEALSGSLEVESPPGQGTRIKAEIPCE